MAWKNDEENKISVNGVLNLLMEQPKLKRYHDLFLSASSYNSEEETVGRSDPYTTYRYSLNEDAILEMGKVKTKLSTNLLHVIKRTLKDKNDLIMTESAMGIRRDTLSFEPIRKLAGEQLQARGNPPYDPSVFDPEFLSDLDWKDILLLPSIIEDTSDICWFCEDNIPDEGASASYKLHGKEAKNPSLHTISTKVRIPRCTRCQEIHKKNKKRYSYMMMGCGLLFVAWVIAGISIGGIGGWVGGVVIAFFLQVGWTLLIQHVLLPTPKGIKDYQQASTHHVTIQALLLMGLKTEYTAEDSFLNL